MKYNTGDRIGRWEVLAEIHKNHRPYYTCRCECGTVKDVCGRSLEQGISSSCGCLRHELLIGRARDLTGLRVGKLEVICRDENRDGYWICKCDCGNQTSVKGTSLTRKNKTNSCGCIQHEGAVKTGENTIARNSEKMVSTNVKYNTNFSVIESKNPPKNNKSGYKGIHWDESRKKWAVYIQVHGKHIYCGRYAKIEDAVEARAKAEEKYFAPLIEAKKEEK